jgi:hypothetical protein
VLFGAIVGITYWVRKDIMEEIVFTGNKKEWFKTLFGPKKEADDPVPPPVAPTYVTARYVKLMRSTVGTLQVNEIEVFGADGVKYPIAGITPTSSTVATLPGYDATNLNDGDLTDTKHTETGSGVAEWVKLDLGSDKVISKVEITNKTGANHIGAVLTITDAANAVKYTSSGIATVVVKDTFVPTT